MIVDPPKIRLGEGLLRESQQIVSFPTRKTESRVLLAKLEPDWLANQAGSLTTEQCAKSQQFRRGPTSVGSRNEQQLSNDARPGFTIESGLGANK
jgi:hypothetical protein